MNGSKKRKFEVLHQTTTVCQEINSTLEAILQHKQKEDLGSIKALLTKCSLLFLDLKEGNREVQLETEAIKLETSKEKQKIDSLNLQLSNLLYEKDYLKREIKRCQEFCSKQKPIDLVPENVFFSTAPQELTHPENEHQKMLNRLTFELKERKRLVEYVNELKTRKKALGEVNAQKKKFLDDLQNKLKTIAQTAAPVQQFIPLQSLSLMETNAIEYLPSPLYVLFYQASIYKDTFDSTVDVSVVGKVEDAVTLSKGENKKDGEQLLVHPLAVLVTIPVQVARGNKLFSMKFEYLVNQNIIAVSAEGVDHAQSLLVNLYQNDTGRKSPNPTNTLLGSIDGKLKGRPYKWAQWLGGLDFLPDQPQEKLTRYHAIEDVMGHIKNRLQVWQKLMSQLESLAKLSLPSVARISSFPHQSLSTIVAWEEITKANYNKGDLADASKEEDGELTASSALQLAEDTTWESYSSRYFKAIFRKDKVQLQALIEVSPEYPIRAPVFKLSLLQKGERAQFPTSVIEKADPAAMKLASAPSFDNNLKNIETEINANYSKFTLNGEPDDMLLSFQIQKLQVCFDIYCETIEYGEEVKKVQTTRPFHGRGRTCQFSL